jgi:glutamate 5-kinase
MSRRTARRASRGRRIVLKFGSGILTRGDRGGLAPAQFRRLASEIADLVDAGHECLLVSSGAVAAGIPVMGLAERPTDLALRQACAAVGQSRLMQAYERAFAPRGIAVAQLLLTHGDIDSRLRSANARTTIDQLLSAGNIVPIINENDSVAVEELRFGDNDRLSSEVATLVGADLLILLTSVDGLLDSGGRLIPEVDDFSAALSHVREEKGRLSVGGMVTKIEAARRAVGAGIAAVIASGLVPGVIARAAAGKPVGTRFSLPAQKKD